MPAQFVALDLGTTTVKGAVLDLDRRVVGPAARRPFPAPLPGLPPAWFEVDPGQIVGAARAVLAELLPQAPGCQGLMLCGQTGGLILTTPEGAPLSNYISWRDQRLTSPAPGGGAYFDRLAQRLTPDDWRVLGQEVRPGASLSFLFWLAQERRLPAEPAVACTLAEFVLAQLSGSPPTVEPTTAPGLLNLEQGDWHHALFERLGLGALRWPRLRAFGEPAGQVTLAGQSFPAYPPVGDQQCSLLGAGLRAGELSLNISTGSQASRLAARFAPGPYQVRPYFAGQFLNTLTHLPAGRALNVLLGLLEELPAAQGRPLTDPWDYVHAAAEAVTETDLQVDLAFFPTPVGGQGAISRIREDNLSLGHLFHAAFCAMADNYEVAALRLAPGRDWQTLVFSGGLAQRLPLLRRLILARLPGPHRLSLAVEDSLNGLLALALAAAGRAPSLEAATQEAVAHEPR
jgi:sugar (pentulose or hexulose) kinase